MSPEVPGIHPDMSVRDALFKLRETAHELETIYTVPITREDRRLVGVVSLREIFTADAALTMADIMHDPIFARASADAEETARWFLPLDILALPIVDDSHRLVGLLTWDDATDIVEEEDSEDSARAGGTEALQQPYLSTPLLKLVRSRIVWLLVLAVSALLTVQVLDSFEGTLAKAVVLSLFIPLLTGTGGQYRQSGCYHGDSCFGAGRCPHPRPRCRFVARATRRHVVRRRARLGGTGPGYAGLWHEHRLGHRFDAVFDLLDFCDRRRADAHRG